MKVIIDVQFFKISDNTYQPKELAAYNGCTAAHYLFRRPFPFHMLSERLQKQANWVMNHHHSIDWDEGFTPAYQFRAIFQRLVRDADEVYVKGHEKATFLRKHTDKPIVEIQERPALSPSAPACIYHSNPICYCALSNVYHLYEHYVMV